MQQIIYSVSTVGLADTARLLIGACRARPAPPDIQSASATSSHRYTHCIHEAMQCGASNHLVTVNPTEVAFSLLTKVLQGQ